MPSTGSPHYVYKDWVSRISVGRLKSISREYRLGDIARWPSLNEIPHLPHAGYMAFSEAILKAGLSLPVHPLVDDVLQFFDVVPVPAHPEFLLYHNDVLTLPFQRHEDSSDLSTTLFTYSGSRPSQSTWGSGIQPAEVTSHELGGFPVTWVNGRTTSSSTPLLI